MMTKRVSYDLFIDESGTFKEGLSPTAFASQVAGLLAPEGVLTEGKAEDWLAAAMECSREDLPKTIHLTEMAGKRDAIVARLCPVVARDGRVTAVRLVNKEKMSAGGTKENYLALVAELVVRVLLWLRRREGLPSKLVLRPGRDGVVRR